MVLLFDLDGTLVDSAKGIAMALSILRTSRGGDVVDVARVRPLVSRGVSALVEDTLGSFACDSAEDVKEFRHILQNVPMDTFMIYPGVVDALRSLKVAEHRFAIITNKPEKISRDLLDKLDLTQFFGVIVGGDSLPVCKPNPRPLHHALDALGVGSCDAMMIGDSDVDAKAAAAAHVPFLLFEGGYGAKECDGLAVAGRFADFADLFTLVDRERAAK